jgi:hypothetical protein
VPSYGRFWLDYRLVGDESIPRAIRVSCGGPVTCGYAYLDITLPREYGPY